MGLYPDPRLEKGDLNVMSMALNSSGAMAFGAAWNACGKPGSWRNADRQWKAT